MRETPGARSQAAASSIESKIYRGKVRRPQAKVDKEKQVN